MKNLVFTTIFYTFCLLVAGQQTPAVNFIQLDAELHLDPEKKSVSGEISYSFDILEPTDSIFIDAQKMDFSEVFLNNQIAEFGTDGKKFWIIGNFSPATNQELRLKYQTRPQQTMYFIPKKSLQTAPQDYQIWTQGQGKYTSHWLPSFDEVTEKVIFNIAYTVPAGKTVVANGELVETTPLNDSLARWEFRMQRPMSSYLVAVAVGDFEHETQFSKSGIPLELYFPRGMEARLEPTYRHTRFMMDFFEEKTGVAYPWQNYKQVPVRDFLYSGMENTGATIFSDIFLIDSIGFHDQNYVSVNAHELAHQWFGNMVTAASAKHHWLQEGLATYFALRAEKEIFGSDYYYFKLFRTAEQLKQESDAGKGEAVVSLGASSLTYYQKGAWALHILNELLGKKTFEAGIKNYLLKYQFSAATTQDFLKEMEAVSGKDLSQFRKDWLEQSAFQGAEALKSLRKSKFIENYLKLAAVKPFSIEEKRKLLRDAFKFPVNDYLAQEAVLQLALENPVEVIDLYKMAFATQNILTRQTLAATLEKIPPSLKKEFETLLDDDSYYTRERALFNLWLNFPQDRMKYFKKLDDTEGLLDKNIRCLWLALNLATPEVSTASKKVFLEELSGYTAPQYRFQVRQNAFNYLYQLEAFDANSLENLKLATKHFNYRFRDYAKKLLQQLEASTINAAGSEN